MNVARALGLLVALDLILILLNAFDLAPSFIKLDEEQNFTTWYSSAKLLGSALAAIWCMRLERPADLAGARRWIWPGIALLFVALSMDETATAHERLAARFMSGAAGDSLRTRLLGGDASKDAFAWPVLFAPIIAAIVIFLTAALYRQVKQNRRSFFLGLAGCAAVTALNPFITEPTWMQQVAIDRLEEDEDAAELLTRDLIDLSQELKAGRWASAAARP